MRILRSALVCLAAEGRRTLQIPEIVIGEPEPGEQELEFPDDWFVHLRHDTPCVGRQQGFLHLTRAGYLGCQSMLREAFVGAGGHWPDFERAAEIHFIAVDRAKQRAVAKLTRDLRELTALET